MTPDGCDVAVIDARDAIVVSLAGDLDFAGAAAVGGALNEQLRRQPSCLVIDLSEADFVDSTGLSVLLDTRRRAVRLGIRLTLACDVQSTLELLALMRLDRDFKVYPTRAAALAACELSRRGS
jgi:anti-anti-sigma factor